MPTVKLVASTYSVSNATVTVSDADNMYTDTSSTTYATITHTTSGTTAYYCYIKGFNFGAVPSNANVTSIAIRIKGRLTGLSTGSSYNARLYNNTSTITGASAASTAFSSGSSATTVTVPYTGTWDTLKGYGADLGIRVCIRRSSRNTQGYLYVYGAEIEVTYSTPNTITSTLSGNGTIVPSGAASLYIGETYMLEIIPANDSDTVTATKDGVDITSSLVESTGGTISATAESFTTGFSITGINFYTSTSSQGNNFQYAVGHTAESPGSTSSGSGSWTYVKTSSGSTNGTGYADFVFDFSSIPEGAVIDSVQVKCYGAVEDSSQTTSHADITLYSGNTQKGTMQRFTSSTNSIITISDVGTWTRDELQSAKLRFTVGYYGGHIFGITWAVTYHSSKFYTYTYTVDGDATIAVTISSGGITKTIYFKNNGSWVAATKAYKKVNGSWVQQTNLSNVFDANTNYVKG